MINFSWNNLGLLLPLGPCIYNHIFQGNNPCQNVISSGLSKCEKNVGFFKITAIFLSNLKVQDFEVRIQPEGIVEVAKVEEFSKLLYAKCRSQ